LPWGWPWSDGRWRADLDEGTGTGTPDGGVTIDDLLFYLGRFASGCWDAAFVV